MDADVDPRIERTRRRVLEAAMKELASAGYGGFRMDGVSARSGVARSTIYRHWPHRLALVADAFEALNVQPAAEARAGEMGLSPRARVRALVAHLAERFRDPTFSACVPALIDGAERDAALRRFHHRYNARRRGALTRAITDGIAAGEVRSDLDPELAAVALAGTILYLRTMTPRRFDPQRAGALVDAILGPPPRDTAMALTSTLSPGSEPAGAGAEPENE